MNKLYVFFESSYNVACIALFFKSNKKKFPAFEHSKNVDHNEKAWKNIKVNYTIWQKSIRFDKFVYLVKAAQQ